jgi:small subunit ribosomal protein S9
MAKEKVQYLGTGRRKSSVARVILTNGKGEFIINGRPFDEYIPSAATRLDVVQPLALTESENKYDIQVNVYGGGLSGQAGAIRLGITRALMEFNPELRAVLNPAGLVTSDPLYKERK